MRCEVAAIEIIQARGDFPAEFNQPKCAEPVVLVEQAQGFAYDLAG